MIQVQMVAKPLGEENQGCIVSLNLPLTGAPAILPFIGNELQTEEKTKI